MIITKAVLIIWITANCKGGLTSMEFKSLKECHKAEVEIKEKFNNKFNQVQTLCLEKKVDVDKVEK